MPMLTTVSPSTTTQMTTNIHYHTQLQAVWKSDYVHDVTLILIREENTGSTGWNVTNSHGCRIQYIDKNGNLNMKSVYLIDTLIFTLSDILLS